MDPKRKNLKAKFTIFSENVQKKRENALILLKSKLNIIPFVLVTIWHNWLGMPYRRTFTEWFGPKVKSIFNFALEVSVNGLIINLPLYWILNWPFSLSTVLGYGLALWSVSITTERVWSRRIRDLRLIQGYSNNEKTKVEASYDNN